MNDTMNGTTNGTTNNTMNNMTREKLADISVCHRMMQPGTHCQREIK